MTSALTTAQRDTVQVDGDHHGDIDNYGDNYGDNDDDDMAFLYANSNSATVSMRSVLEQATATFKMPHVHRSEEKAVAGVHDLYQTSMKKFPDLADSITDGAQGPLLRIQISNFFFAFRGRKDTDKHTAAIATFIHVAQSRPDLDLLGATNSMQDDGAQSDSND